MYWPLEQAPEVLGFLRDFAPEAPDDLGIMLVAHRAPPLPFLPPGRYGTPAFGLLLTWAGEIEQGMRVLAPLLHLGTPLGDLVRPVPYLPCRPSSTGLPHLAMVPTGGPYSCPRCPTQRSSSSSRWPTHSPRRSPSLEAVAAAVSDGIRQLGIALVLCAIGLLMQRPLVAAVTGLWVGRSDPAVLRQFVWTMDLVRPGEGGRPWRSPQPQDLRLRLHLREAGAEIGPAGHALQRSLLSISCPS